MPDRVLMYGRETCEDTLLARDRLRRYGVPLTAFDVVADPEAARRVEAWNGGNRVTPTFDIAGQIHAEPELHRLDELLRDAGYEIDPPQPREIAGAASGMPASEVATADGRAVALDQLLGRRLVLFFAHDPRCLACRGYARALLATVERSGAGGARSAFAVLSDEPAIAERWLHGEAELPPDGVLVDADGSWRGDVAAATAIPRERPFLVFVRPDGRIARASESDEAGGLVAPAVAAAWLGETSQGTP